MEQSYTVEVPQGPVTVTVSPNYAPEGIEYRTRFHLDDETLRVVKESEMTPIQGAAMLFKEPYCNHDRAAWDLTTELGHCECGAPILTDEQIRKLMVLRSKCESEPGNDDVLSEDSRQMAREYFDELMVVLTAGPNGGPIVRGEQFPPGYSYRAARYQQSLRTAKK